MSKSVVIGGTIAIDHVKTPVAEAKNLLGGSASYASLAASYFTQPVYLVGIVGQDYPEEHLSMLADRGVSLVGVERSSADSFTWSGEYHEGWSERTTHAVALNVLECWEVKVPAEAQGAEVVVLANMSPENQLQMLDQCGGGYVIADTMDLWISIANEPLHEVLKRIDLLVLNEGEARELSGEGNLLVAGEILRQKGPKLVIIKVGEFGAMIFGEDESGERFFRVPAYPLKSVADPTGAGDSFLGALAGYLCTLEDSEYSFEQIRDAALYGSVAAASTCEDFSTLKLEKGSREQFEARLAELKQVTCW